MQTLGLTIIGAWSGALVAMSGFTPDTWQFYPLFLPIMVGAILVSA